MANPIIIEPLRILDFDIENRPLTYAGNDFTFGEVTAIAASFGLDLPVQCWLLGRDDPRDMLQDFVWLYDQADIVTGHYIRKHDLPIVNGALVEYGLPALRPKLTSDTCLDITIKGVSKSQESLAAMLGVASPKVYMSQADWRVANRLERDGIELAAARVVGDVRQHQELRLALAKLGHLGPAKVWQP